MSVKVTSKNVVVSNIVDKESLRRIQVDTLHSLKDSLILSAGPYGSTTGIIRDGEFTEYTKDGHTILESIKLNMSIENSIQKELTELTRHVVKKVGDGTTSSVILSSLIFDELCKMEEGEDGDKVPPYLIIENFKEVVEDLKEMILKERRDLTLDDVYKIAMVCTNNNKEVSKIIYDIYEEHGLDVFIDVGISPNESSIVKHYDGLTLEEGYSDPVYINTISSDKNSDNGSCIIRNPKIYAFQDPIDTIEMTNLFSRILFDNIIEPYKEWASTEAAASRYGTGTENMVPTVIMAPKISIDNSTIMTDLVEFLYGFDPDNKPPILIISNIGTIHQEIYSDLWRLCGCKPIKKYLDPAIQAKEIEEGKAPTPDTVVEFYGTAEEVSSNVYKTSFINPQNMFNGDGEYTQEYKSQINFLETELKVAEEHDSVEDIYNIKRRLNSLKANMVDYLIGGVTITDRDSVRALVEDAVKNIRSASSAGVGYGTNYEGLKASSIYYENIFDSTIKGDISKVIYRAYSDVSKIIYETAFGSEAGSIVLKSLVQGIGPMNIVTKEFSQDVLSSIESDIVILDAISKIITVMFTTNQILVQTPAHNMYIKPIK